MKSITQKMADKMITYRIIGNNSSGMFTHGPDIKSYDKAVKELENYRLRAKKDPFTLTNTYTLTVVTCTVLPV